MTPATAAIQPATETLPIPKVVAVEVTESHPSPTMTVVPKVTMEPVRGVSPAVPKAGAKILIPDEEMDTQEGVMEIPAGKGLRTLGVHLDVVGSDTVVMVDAALLATPEELDRESKAQRLSTYLSMRFNRIPAPRAKNILTPA